MKYLLLLLTLTFNINLYAYIDLDTNKTKIVCNSYNPEAGQLLGETIVLTQIEDWVDGGVLHDHAFDHSAEFVIDRYDSITQYPSTIHLKGRAFSEDINFIFQSDNGNVEFVIYLDQLHKSVLVMESTNEYSTYVCN